MDTHKNDATSFLDSELDQLHGCAKLNFNTNESCCAHFPQQDSTIPLLATAAVCLPPKNSNCDYLQEISKHAGFLSYCFTMDKGK